MKSIKTVDGPVVNPDLVPPGVLKSFAHCLLEDFRNHPELADRYEQETGKKFYTQRKKGHRK